MARILIIRSPDPALEGKSIELAAGAVTLGREAGSVLTVADPALSRRHAILAVSGGGWNIEDLGSGNGTWVNGERVVRRPLRNGDRVLAGATELVFEDAERTALLPSIGAAPAPEATLLQPLPPPAISAPPPLPPSLPYGPPPLAGSPRPASPPPPPIPPVPVAEAPGLRRPGLSGMAVAAIVSAAILLAAGGGWLGYRLLATGPAPSDGESRGEEIPRPAESQASGNPSAEGTPAASDPSEDSTDSPAAGEVMDQRPATDPDPGSPPVQDRPGWWKKRPQEDPPPSPSAPSPSGGRPAPAQTSAAAAPPAPATAPHSTLPTTPAPAAPRPEPAIVYSRTYECRKAAEFHVDPESAMVTVEGKAIGKADDWDGMFGGKAYAFPAPGSYSVKLSLKGYRTEWIRIVVRPEAKAKTAQIELELAEQP